MRLKFAAFSLAPKEKQWRRLHPQVAMSWFELKKKKNRSVWLQPVCLREGEFNTTTQELKFYPVKFRQHFRMSVRHLKELLCQLARRLRRERTNYQEPTDPEQWRASYQHHFEWSEVQPFDTSEKNNSRLFALWKFTAGVEGRIDFKEVFIKSELLASQIRSRCVMTLSHDVKQR